jgi:hypothetical protein
VGINSVYSILFCSILFYSILFYSIVFCSVPFCSVLFCSILFHAICTFTPKKSNCYIVKMSVNEVIVAYCMFYNLHELNTVRSLIKRNAAVTSWLPAWTAWLTTKCYNIFQAQVKYRSIKARKSTYLFYRRCWKCCLCMWTHSLYCLNRLKFTASSFWLLTI